MKNYLSIFLICFVMALNSFAQEVIAPAGETYKDENAQLSWTLGETLITTAQTDSKILTQGFLQTKLVVTALDQPEIPDLNVKVYPNPTSNYVVVHFDENMFDAHIQLFDIAGKKLKESIVSNNDTQMNITEYSEGTYLLKLFDDKFQPIQTFKIIKR